jgi:hypothetical protein
MATTNEMTTAFQGLEIKEVHLSSIGQSQKILKGTLAISVGGVAYVAGNHTSQYLQVPGADANGALLVWTPQANVRYSQITGGINKTLGVSVVYSASFVDVIVQLATDGAGASTSTAQAVVNAIMAHGTASTLVRPIAQGTGLGLASALVAALVPVVFVAGVALNTYDNASVAAVTGISMVFHCGGGIMLAGLSADAPTLAMIGSRMAIVDNITVRATVGFADLTVVLRDITPEGKTFFEIV